MNGIGGRRIRVAIVTLAFRARGVEIFDKPIVPVLSVGLEKGGVIV
jgi:hypothetical protein